MRRRPAALTAALAGAIGLVACTAGTARPWTLATGAVRARPVDQGAWISDYDTALASIARVMEGDMGLPAVPVDLRFYPDRAAFRAALEADGYDGQLALDAAATMTAITGHRRVLINESVLRPLEWPYRVALLAHELTHAVQYELSGGRRGASEQWVREGFAEWVEVQVLAELGFTTRPEARRIAEARVRRAQALPALTSLVTFPDWVRAGVRIGTEGLYAQAMLAAERLVDRHGVATVLAYFQSFERSDDRERNFRRAFGEDLSAFDRDFRAGLARASP